VELFSYANCWFYWFKPSERWFHVLFKCWRMLDLEEMQMLLLCKEETIMLVVVVMSFELLLCAVNC
jgi:hypothetical protein